VSIARSQVGDALTVTALLHARSGEVS
jgi:hypothetical protein